MNDFGTVIGIFFDAAGNVHAFTLREGRFRLADLPGGLQTIPFSINDRGQIVGEYVTTPNTNGFGYLEQSDKHVTFTTAPNSQAQGTFFISINNRDQVLGAYTDQSGAVQNFLRTGDDYALFNLPEHLGATGVSAQTVNDLDDIVGFYTDGLAEFSAKCKMSCDFWDTLQPMRRTEVLKAPYVALRSTSIEIRAIFFPRLFFLACQRS